MFGGPTLEVDLHKIKENAEAVSDLCHRHGVQVLGVTKGFSAISDIVKAMNDGGVDGLADARLENIISLREAGFNQELTMLRLPRLSKVDEVVRYADASLNSEFDVMKALNLAAEKQGKTHRVILMVDVGDLREGVMPELAEDMAYRLCGLKSIRLAGIGSNMGCFGGVLPSPVNLGLLQEIARSIEHKVGFKLDVISGGGTSSLLLLENCMLPRDINQLRVGEGILLGTDTTNNRIIPWLHQDAFVLHAEVIEVSDKPSIPVGEIGLDALGNSPVFTDRGVRRRAILALGKQDVILEGIRPVDSKIIVLGASSDHLIVDITDAEETIKVGCEIMFHLTYSGLLSLCSSKYVNKSFKEGEHWLSVSEYPTGNSLRDWSS